MDIKIKGIDEKILTTALEQARKGRLEILDIMLKTMADEESNDCLRRKRARYLYNMAPVFVVCATIGFYKWYGKIREAIRKRCASCKSQKGEGR